MNIFFNKKSGYTKSPCVLCLWDSRNHEHFSTQKQYPTQNEIVLHRSKTSGSNILGCGQKKFHSYLTQILNKITSTSTKHFIGKRIPEILYVENSRILYMVNLKLIFRWTSGTEAVKGSRSACQAFNNVAYNSLGKRKSSNYMKFVRFFLTAIFYLNNIEHQDGLGGVSQRCESKISRLVGPSQWRHACFIY